VPLFRPLNFSGPSNSLAARVIENLAENAPPIVYSFVIYRDKAAKFSRVV